MKQKRELVYKESIEFVRYKAAKEAIIPKGLEVVIENGKCKLKRIEI